MEGWRRGLKGGVKALQAAWELGISQRIQLLQTSDLLHTPPHHCLSFPILFPLLLSLSSPPVSPFSSPSPHLSPFPPSWPSVLSRSHPTTRHPRLPAELHLQEPAAPPSGRSWDLRGISCTRRKTLVCQLLWEPREGAGSPGGFPKEWRRGGLTWLHRAGGIPVDSSGKMKSLPGRDDGRAFQAGGHHVQRRGGHRSRSGMTDE